MFEQLMQRIKLVFGTGTATRVETNKVQVKMATGIINDRIKRLHNYGFMSRPLRESKAYLLFIGGDTSRGVAVCVEDERYQIELQDGEVAILDNKGNVIHLTAQGIRIDSTKKVIINCNKATINATNTTINSETEINGNTIINGNATVTGICAVGGLAGATGGAVPATGGFDMTGGDITADGISLKGHTHPETGTGGGTTGTPQ